MEGEVVAVGSLEALAGALALVGAVGEDLDVVVVTTAAAFTGETSAALAVADALAPTGARVEALMAPSREAADEPYFARRVEEAAAVVLVDGAALHARAVWRASALGAALERARLVVAVGSVASVLGAHMVDPRGGAPTTGLGLIDGVVLAVPAPPDQITRTRRLLGELRPLVVLGPRAAVAHRGGRWRVLRQDDLEVTLGSAPAELG
jgi:hypothetical protein